jgi:hypothetical protein
MKNIKSFKEHVHYNHEGSIDNFKIGDIVTYPGSSGEQYEVIENTGERIDLKNENDEITKIYWYQADDIKHIE